MSQSHSLIPGTTYRLLALARHTAYKGEARDGLPTCSNMSFGRSSCSSIVRMARLISSFESFSLGGGEGKRVNCSRTLRRLEERVLSHPPTWPGDRDS